MCCTSYFNELTICYCCNLWLFLFDDLDSHCLLLHSRSLSPSLGVSSLYRLQTTTSPQVKSSPSGFNFQSPGGSTMSFPEHALCMELMESLVPEICLDHIWTESGNIPRSVCFLCHSFVSGQPHNCSFPFWDLDSHVIT